jgi:DNA-binding NarL/FixJ family response regulator
MARLGNAKWDLVLMDLCLPGINGIETTRRLKEILPRLSVVIFTVFEEPAAIVRAIRPGADDFLLKKTSAHELLCQLRALAVPSAPTRRPGLRPRYLFSGFRPAALSLCARVLKRSRSQSASD